MPNPIKKKEYTIYFDFGEHGVQSINDIRNIDTKTILFRTPLCPLLPGNEDIKALIIIQENQSILTAIQFHYVTRMLFYENQSIDVFLVLAIKTIIHVCPRCREYGMNNPASNKRRWQLDNAESLVSKMNQLSIEQVS